MFQMLSIVQNMVNDCLGDGDTGTIAILTNEQDGRHSPQRVVAHGSQGPAGAAARAAGVVQADQLLLSRGAGAGPAVRVV